MTASAKLLFLTGASGNTELWRRVSDGLNHPARRVLLGWPGFGGVPSDPQVRGFEDLVALVSDALNEPADLLAHSMGGVVALHAALRRPERVRHLVLSATSGGVDVGALGGRDWRPDFVRQFPDVPSWFAEHARDLSASLPRLAVPTLLLWGDADPISPVAVGEHLRRLLPNASLRIFAGADHDLVHTHAVQLLPHIEAHLRDGALPDSSACH